MKRKKKRQTVFPAADKTEFARYDDPDDFPFDAGLSDTDAIDAPFFRDDAYQPGQNAEKTP